MKNPIASEIGRHLNLPTRLKNIVPLFLFSLMLPSPKHTLTFAAQVSGYAKSQFSRLLAHHRMLAHLSLIALARAICGDIAEERNLFVLGAPWTIAIIIDATLQKRSSKHPGNCQKFNHGKGYVIGHQWTNIILLINGVTVPLPPISFFTKKERARRNLPKETEQDAVIRYLEGLDLHSYVGVYNVSEVVVLADSGYDNKKLQQKIVDLGWDFVVALKISRGAKSETQFEDKKKSCRISELFRTCRYAPWKTVRDHVNGWKQKKRKEFRVRELLGFLNGVATKVKFVLSEERGSRKGRKFIACSNTKVGIGAIVRAYRQRWNIELFHKDVKSYLGFEDVSCHDFESVDAHVHWVYCAYLLLPKLAPESKSILEGKHAIRRNYENRGFRKILALANRFDGMASIKTYCSEAMQA